MAPLAVDPRALYAAGSAVGAIGDGLAASLAVLTAGFAANTGHDLAGMVFGLAYQDAAKSLLKAATTAVNACRKIGGLIEQGATNYSIAEAASTLGGGAGVLPSPCPPVELAAPGPPGTLGPGQPAPSLWWLVQSLVHGVWPDGDVAGLRAAAARWRGFGAALGGVQGTLNASKALLDTQHIPEADNIDHALTEMGSAAKTIGEQCGKLAATIDKFADRVDHAQQAIRDLLNRLGSLADIGHDVMLIIEGEALDEVEKIAKDINAVLQQLGQEARAYEQGIKLVMQAADAEIVKGQKYARRALVQFLGADVGNPVATAFDIWINVDEGAVKDAAGIGLGLADLSPHWFLADPQGAAATWTGFGKDLWKGSLFNGFVNPQEFKDANLQQLKGLAHLDDWSRDRPGLGAGENLFDLLTAVVPGAGEAGAAADGAGAAARGAEEEAAAAGGRAGGKAAETAGGLTAARGALTDITKAGGDLTKNLEGVTKDLPKIDPPASGTPVALPPGKPFEAPVESAPRPPDAAPGAPQGSTPPGSPGSPGGPHGPASAPPSVPGGPVGPHDPAPAPGVPPAAGGLHDPAPAPAPPSAPGEPRSPHNQPSVPLGDSHEPVPAAAETPHDPVSAPSDGPHDPEPSPPRAPTTPSGSHDPASAPPDSPHGPAPDGTRDPVSTPAEPARAEGPHDPMSAPAEGPHEPASVPGGGSPLTSVPAPVGERMPPTITQTAEHPPERAPAPPSGSPADPAPVPAYSPQAVVVAKSTPHVTAPGGRPAEKPTTGGSPRAPGKGGPASGEPKPPNNGGQQPPRDLPGRHQHVPTDGGDDVRPPGSSNPNDLSAMDDYTGVGYRDLNDALRGNAVEASQLARIEAIKNAMQKLPSYRGPVVRGTDLPPEVLAQYRPGEVIMEKAFLSTSTNPAVARSTAFSGNVEFRIYSKTGRDISSVSMFPGEREILFPPGTHFYVAGKAIDPLTGKTIVEMIER